MTSWINDQTVVPPKAQHANLDLDNWYQWSPAKSWPMFRPTPVTLESELWWPLRPVLSVFLWYPPLSWVTSLVSRKSSSSLGSIVSRVSQICHEAIFSYLVVASHWTLRTGWQPHWHWRLVLRSHMTGTGRAPDWPGCEGYAPRNLVCSQLRHSELCWRCSLCAHCSGLVPSKALDVGWAEVGLWGVRPALSDGWEKQRNWKTLIFWNIEQQRRNDHPHQMVTTRTRHQTQPGLGENRPEW